jgi:Winged helix DNA-binding domain
VRELSVRELNRATLARQLLLERRRLSVPAAFERLCAVQAQEPTAPYVALWSRLAGFDRDALTRAYEQRRIVRATLMRVTIHMLSGRDFLALAPIWKARRHEQLGVEARAAEASVRAALANGAPTHAELRRAVGDAVYHGGHGSPRPVVHVPPAGTWRFYGRVRLADAEAWLGSPLGDAEAGAKLLVRRYLAAFGPASRADLLRFSGLRAKYVAPGLDGLRRFVGDDGRELLDVPRAPLPAADTPAPVRFLGRWDNAHLGYDRRARILPDEFAQLQIGHNGSQTFLVDGFVSGSWEVERARSSATLVLTAFAPLPRAARREVDEEASALVRWHDPQAGVHRVRWS